jgi:hypothetical protein
MNLGLRRLQHIPRTDPRLGNRLRQLMDLQWEGKNCPGTVDDQLLLTAIAARIRVCSNRSG